jgi:hypothetical protein
VKRKAGRDRREIIVILPPPELYSARCGPKFRTSKEIPMSPQTIKPLLFLVIGILSHAVMFNACGSSRPKFTYPELSNLTEIVVKDNDSLKQIKTIRDQHQIDAVVKFINGQRSGWSIPRFSFPISKLQLFLYGDGFKGSFGVDKSSFSMQRIGRYDSKPATEKEVQEILNLIGVEKQMLEWN